MKMTQKAAIFGKLNQFDHFKITSLRAKSGNLLSQRGAMFGLDARIALAIFGGLSVISGAALYSAIQQSRVVALLNGLEEMGKAYYAVVLDTGEEPALLDPTSNKWDVDPLPLINKTGTGWQGPYTSLQAHSNGITLAYPGYDSAFFSRATNDAWDSSTDLATTECTLVANANKPCYVWAAIGKTNKMEQIAKALDEYVDGSATPDTGRVRVIGDDFVMYQVGLALE